MKIDTTTRGDCFFCWAWNLESVLDTLIDYGCDITSVTPVTYIWLPFFTFGLRYAITYVQPLYADDNNPNGFKSKKYIASNKKSYKNYDKKTDKNSSQKNNVATENPTENVTGQDKTTSDN